MKFNLEFELNDNHLPLDYTRCFISFLKKSVKAADINVYESMYETNTPKMKPYTFSLYLPQRQVEGDLIRLGGDKIRMTFSCADLPLAIVFLNGFTELKKEVFPLPNGNEMTLVRFTTEMHPMVSKQEVRIKFLSPLLVLKRDIGARKNYYLTWDNEEFDQQLKENLKYQLNEFSMDSLSFDHFELTPVQPKRLGQRVFGQLALGNGGVFDLKGTPELIQFLLEAGIGSRRSAGFGLFEIIS